MVYADHKQKSLTIQIMYMKLKNHKIPLIQPILSRNYSKKSIRPLFSALNNSKLSEAYNLNIERWDESLEKILNIKFTN